MLLAHTRHATVVQPKYETLRSRERIEHMSDAFFHGTPEQLRRLCKHEFQARYFLLHAPEMWSQRYAAGLPITGAIPLAGTSAAFFIVRSAQLQRNTGIQAALRSAGARLLVANLRGVGRALSGRARSDDFAREASCGTIGWQL